MKFTILGSAGFIGSHLSNHLKVDSTVHKIRNIKGITASYSMPVLYGQGGTIDEQE